MSEHRPWLWALTSALSILLGLAMLAGLPGELAEARRYEARAVEDHERGAVVAEKRSFPGRGSNYRIRLRFEDGSTHAVEIESRADWERFRDGTEVLATEWGGEVTSLRHRDGASVETTDSPVHQRALVSVLPLMFVPWGGFGLWFAALLRRESGSWWKKADQPLWQPSAGWGFGCLALAVASVVPVFLLSAAVYALAEIALLTVAAMVAVVGGVGLIVLVARGVARHRRLRSRSGHDAVRRRRRRPRRDDTNDPGDDGRHAD
ncbi:MAG TPA: hypothetical protein VF230_00675 [Acidimicrobiales bacterium]